MIALPPGVTELTVTVTIIGVPVFSLWYFQWAHDETEASTEKLCCCYVIVLCPR